MTDRPEYTLLATDDAMVWASEFCRIFNGHMITADQFNPAQHAPVDPGTMVTWFANAMQTAIDMYERRKLNEKELRQQVLRKEVEELDDLELEEQDPTDEITLEESFLEGFQEGRPKT